MQPMSSAITGLVEGLEAPKPTGLQRGETTSGGSLTVGDSERRAWLAARTPEAVDAALLASVKSSLGVAVNVVKENRFPEDGKPYKVAVAPIIEAKSVEDARAAAERFQGAMVPADPRQVEEWFYAMRLATAGAAKSEMDEEARLNLYGAAMARYPADVAKAALTAFTTRLKDGAAWFPTLPELIAEADRLVSIRKAVIAGLLAWKPFTEEQIKKADARDLLIKAVEVENEAFLCRRSNPEKHAALKAEASELRKRAREMTHGPAPTQDPPEEAF